jgi:hypothetical protein
MYELLQDRFRGGIHRVSLDDPEAAWALGQTAGKPVTGEESRVTAGGA